MSKIPTKLILLIFLFGFQYSYSHTIFYNNDKEIEQLLTELSAEINTTKKYYDSLKADIYNGIDVASVNMQKAVGIEEKVNWLLAKDKLQTKLQKLQYEEEKNITKIRYLKGLSIIKILYEKVLSLDHHFSSMATFNEINKISNPNNYPEFVEVRDLVKSKTKKKGFNLSQLLGKNIYTGTIDMFLNLFNSDASAQQKQTEIKKIECILDFTLRMNNDLNTIYFETAFLQQSNNKIMQDLEQLFKDYTKPIKYTTSLKESRANDDWDTVREQLNSFLEQMDNAIKENKQTKVMRMQIDINFPIDRLLQYITQYNNFIDQGAKYYEKFKIILDSYENQQQCNNNLPVAYKKLKSDIDIAIEKFNTAYKPVEINGSKLKQLLYGVDEYE